MVVYCGASRIHKKPEFAIQHSTKVELIINFKSAKALGLTVPPTLFATGDKVIE